MGENHLLYAHDLAASAVAIVLAALLRMNTDWRGIDPESLRSLVLAVPGFVLTCAVVFPFTCLYTRNGRYATVADLLGIVRAAGSVTLAFVFVLFAVTRLSAFPRSVMAIEALILAPLLALPRAWLKDPGARVFPLGSDGRASAERDSVPVLLLGAGDAADLYLRALQRDPTARHWPVGILLGKGEATGASVLRGVPILGDVDDLETVVEDLGARGLKPRHLIFTETGYPNVETLIDRADRLGLAVSRPAPILEVRVKKELVVKKDAEERTETVSDTVRRTEVERRRVSGGMMDGGSGKITSELVECHFHAEMPAQPEIGRAVRVEVMVTREQIERLSGPTSQKAHAPVSRGKEIILQVLPRANCRTVGEDRASIPVPEAQAPTRLVFEVEGIAAGAAEVWVEARQGAVPLTILRLQPVFVPGRVSVVSATATAVLGDLSG